MDYLNKTVEYYSALANISPTDFFTSREPVFVRNPLLDKPLKGHSNGIDMLVYERDGKYIISCSERGMGFLSIFKGNEISKAAQNNVHKRKFYYTGDDISENIAPRNHAAVMLTEKDYPDYLEFFKAVNPGCGETEWLHGYFSEITGKQCCFGAYTDGKIVSATDSPDLPVLEEGYCEIGINTLPEYRRQGFAREACAAHINSLLARGIVPLWSAGEDNIASRKLAESLRFIELMRVTEISLTPIP